MGGQAGMQTQIDAQRASFTAQMTEAFGRLTTMAMQLSETTARASQTEEERRQALALAVAAQGGNLTGNLGNLVDGKSVGQPWKYEGRKERTRLSGVGDQLFFIHQCKFRPRVEKVVGLGGGAARGNHRASLQSAVDRIREGVWTCLDSCRTS